MKKIFLSSLFAFMFITSLVWAETITGTVKSVDTNSIDVTDGQGKLCTVAIGPETKLKGIKAITELQTGEEVSIEAKDTAGALEAESIKAK